MITAGGIADIPDAGAAPASHDADVGGDMMIRILPLHQDIGTDCGSGAHLDEAADSVRPERAGLAHAE